MRLGERLFRSWILLFGVLPIDYDDITLVSIEPGRGFHERSSMLSMRVWEHERTWSRPAGAAWCATGLRSSRGCRARRLCDRWSSCSPTATGGSQRFGQAVT